MRRSGFCLLALLSVGAPGWSQGPDTRSIPRSEFSLYAGYSLLSPNIRTSNSPESGWNAGIDIGISRNVAAVFDFSQYFSTYNYELLIKTTPFFVMAGPRVWAPVDRSAKARVFVDFLTGGGFIQTGRTKTSYGVFDGLFAGSASSAWSVGGGVDFRAGNHLGLRGQAGYLHTDFTTVDNQIQQSSPSGHVRIVAGILYRR